MTRRGETTAHADMCVEIRVRKDEYRAWALDAVSTAAWST